MLGMKRRQQEPLRRVHLLVLSMAMARQLMSAALFF